MTLEMKRFSIEVLGDTVLFDGFTQNLTWNNWDCPFFTFEQGQKVVEAFNGAKGFDGNILGRAGYDPQRDVFYFVSAATNELEEFGSTDIDGQKFYSIGAGCWIWEAEDKWE